MTTAVLADVAGYECCQHALYAVAWVHWYQHLRGLRPWPMDAPAYEELLLNLPSNNELTGFLGANPRLLPELSFEQWGPVYAFVQFLYERFGPGAVSAPLHAPPGNALRDLGIAEEDWAEAWPQFVYEKSLSGSLSASPVPLPAADLALQCTEGEELMGLRQTDVTTGRSQSLYANVPLSGVNWPDQVYYEPFGPGKGLLLLSRRAITGRARGLRVRRAAGPRPGRLDNHPAPRAGAHLGRAGLLLRSGRRPRPPLPRLRPGQAGERRWLPARFLPRRPPPLS